MITLPIVLSAWCTRSSRNCSAAVLGATASASLAAAVAWRTCLADASGSAVSGLAFLSTGVVRTVGDRLVALVEDVLVRIGGRRGRI